MRVKLIRFIEFHVGDLLCILFSLFKRKHALPNNSLSILVVRDWSLGESLLTLPVLRKIKEMLPQSYIAVAVTASSKPVFVNQPFIDEIIDIRVKNVLRLLRRRFDVALDMMPYFRHSALLGFWCARYVIGFDAFQQRSRLYDYRIPFDDAIHMLHMFDRFNIWDKSYTSTELIPLHSQRIRDEKIQGFLQSNAVKIGVHLGTAETAPWRAWSFDNFKEVIETLFRIYPESVIFLSGSKPEHIINRRMVREVNNPHLVNLESKINIFELAYLMTKIDLFISSDTGPMHVSASMGCITIGLFGPNTPVRFGPFPPERHKALYMPPSGYTPTINVHKGEFGSRHDAKMNVINKITPQMVVSEVNEILGLKPVNRRKTD